MFDSLLSYRKENSSLLKKQIIEGSIAHSLLFSGPVFSGKMSLAIETARTLSCAQEGLESCNCSSCKSFKYLSVPNMIILSDRDHEVRINAFLAMFEEMQSERSKRMLINSIRIALMGYHEAFVDKQDTKNSALFALANDIDILLIDLEQAVIEQSGGIIKELKKTLTPLLQAKRPAVSIDNVRGSAKWTANTAFAQQKRFIILENIENSTIGANNSLLKLLEEPPADTYIILLSSHPKRLLPTILSRVQHHEMKPITIEEKKAIFSNVLYADATHYQSIEEFIYLKGGIPLKELDQGADVFISSVRDATPIESLQLSSIINLVDTPFALSYFFEKIHRALQEYISNQSISIKRVKIIEDEMRQSASKARVYNQQSSVLLETLYYRLVRIV